jgi:hypothetical protein
MKWDFQNGISSEEGKTSFCAQAGLDLFDPCPSEENSALGRTKLATGEALQYPNRS